MGGASVFFLTAALPSAQAAELIVVGQATTAGALRLLAPRFEKETGDKVRLMLGNPGVTYDNLKATPNADVVIVASALHDRLIKEGAAQRFDAGRARPVGDRHGRVGESEEAGGVSRQSRLSSPSCAR